MLWKLRQAMIDIEAHVETWDWNRAGCAYRQLTAALVLQKNAANRTRGLRRARTERKGTR
jgi:hypothetical protein